MKTRKIKSSRRNLKQSIQQELLIVANLFDANNEDYYMVMEDLTKQNQRTLK